MLTLTTAAAHLTTGADQIPLVTETQIEVGLLLAGPAGEHAWKVVGTGAGTVTLARQTPVTITRDINVREVLPISRPEVPRMYIIQPRGLPVMTPDPFTVYLTPGGKLITVVQNVWSESLPIIPALYPAWALPEALRNRINRPQ